MELWDELRNKSFQFFETVLKNTFSPKKGLSAVPLTPRSVGRNAYLLLVCARAVKTGQGGERTMLTYKGWGVRTPVMVMPDGTYRSFDSFTQDELHEWQIRKQRQSMKKAGYVLADEVRVR